MAIDGKLELLRKREAALKEAITQEKVRQQRRRDKEDARLFSIIGEALINHAAQSSGFELMVKQVLQSTQLRDTDRSFLSAKGWL